MVEPHSSDQGFGIPVLKERVLLLTRQGATLEAAVTAVAENCELRGEGIERLREACGIPSATRTKEQEPDERCPKCGGILCPESVSSYHRCSDASVPSNPSDKYAALLRKSEELVIERDALRRSLERHARFRSRVIDLLKNSELAFEQIAYAAGGEPQYLVHRQISEFLSEAEQRVKRASDEDKV